MKYLAKFLNIILIALIVLFCLNLIHIIEYGLFGMGSFSKADQFIIKARMSENFIYAFFITMAYYFIVLFFRHLLKKEVFLFLGSLKLAFLFLALSGLQIYFLIPCVLMLMFAFGINLKQIE